MGRFKGIVTLWDFQNHLIEQFIYTQYRNHYRYYVEEVTHLSTV